VRILVVGQGGREHALCWKIARSAQAEKIYAAPGNGGIASIADIVDIQADDTKALLSFARSEDIDLTVVGPEAPLVGGIRDIFEKEGLAVFGPRRSAAMLEGSKIFAKEAMVRYGVPTARFEVFDDYRKASDCAKRWGGPLVVKADGLCAGKGVTVCADGSEAEEALKEAMVEGRFGAGGRRVVLEERLEGEEASFIVISDGEDVLPLASSQDHKRALDGDRGKNTGGMGAYSPAPVVSAAIERSIMDDIIEPVIKGLASDNMPYKGVLYAGIMVTKGGPKVLEFNVRMGDPETQAILPRLESDIVEIMGLSVRGGLKGYDARWDRRSAVSVVLASGGYPGPYEKGKEICGLDEAARIEDVTIFHAGTKLKKEGKTGGYVTAGGRVLGVTGLGDTVGVAMEKAYRAVSAIEFEGMHFRKDIGKRALAYR